MFNIMHFTTSYTEFGIAMNAKLLSQTMTTCKLTPVQNWEIKSFHTVGIEMASIFFHMIHSTHASYEFHF